MSDALEHRIEDLEIRISHQDLTIEELNQTVYQQWQTIDLLTKQVNALMERLKNPQEPEIDTSPYKPPHW